LRGKPEVNKLLGTYTSSWEDNTKMYLREIGCEVMGWIQVAQNTFVQ